MPIRSVLLAAALLTLGAAAFAQESAITGGNAPHQCEGVTDHPTLPEIADDRNRRAAYVIRPKPSGTVEAITEDLSTGCTEDALHHFFAETRRPWFPSLVAYFPADPSQEPRADLMHQRKGDVRVLHGEQYIWAIVFSERTVRSAALKDSAESGAGSAPPTTQASESPPARSDSVAPHPTSAATDQASVEESARSRASATLIPTSRGPDHLLETLVALIPGAPDPEPDDPDPDVADTIVAFVPVGEHALDSAEVGDSIIVTRDSLFVAIIQLSLEPDTDYQLAVEPLAADSSSLGQGAAYGWFRNTDIQRVELGVALGAIVRIPGHSTTPFRPGLYTIGHVNLRDIRGDAYRGRWPAKLGVSIGASVLAPGRDVFQDVLVGLSLGHMWGSSGLIVAAGRTTEEVAVDDATVTQPRWGLFFGLDFRF